MCDSLTWLLLRYVTDEQGVVKGWVRVKRVHVCVCLCVCVHVCVRLRTIQAFCWLWNHNHNCLHSLVQRKATHTTASAGDTQRVGAKTAIRLYYPCLDAPVRGAFSWRKEGFCQFYIYLVNLKLALILAESETQSVWHCRRPWESGAFGHISVLKKKKNMQKW